MTLLQALRYFAREALVSLARSAKVSALAVLTIAVSLFLAGVLLLVSRNLSRTVAEWRSDARFVVYLAAGGDAEARRALAAELAGSPWLEGVTEIAPEEARRRFELAFPSLAELVAEGGQGRLPSSIEARASAAAERDPAGFRAFAATLAARSEVETIDDDRDWIAQVETALAVVSAIGVGLLAVLLGASIFTIASVVRFTALLYAEEIAIMRLVGATEFFIRGPFYLEGVLQGLLGAGVSVGGLFALYLGLRPHLEDSIFASVTASRFLSATDLALLLLFGALAGLAGAVVSRGREGLPGERAPG